MKDANGRDAGLDAARGIVILLVVAGHVFAPPVQTLIYTFHMPFFFFVGGHLFRPGDDLTFLVRRFRQLIVPYAIFLVVFSLPELLEAAETSGLQDVLWRVRRLALGGEQLVAPLSVFWFPTCYFLTAVIYNSLRRRLGDKVLWGLSFALMALATANQFLLPQFWAPLALNVCALAVPMFHIGARFGRHIFNPSGVALMCLTAIAVAYLVAVQLDLAPPMDMKRAIYGLPFITLLAAVACTAVCAGLGRLASRVAWYRAPLVFFGAASMTIMYIHRPAQMLIGNVGLEGPWARFLLSLTLCLVAHSLFLRWRITRELFLGQARATTAVPDALRRE